MRFTIILLLGLFLASCSEPAETQFLIGKWQLDAEASKASIKDKALSNMEFRTMEGMLSQAANFHIEYKEDGTFNINHSTNAPILGKWRISSDGKELITNLYGRDEIDVIEELNNERLVITASSNKNIVFKRVFIPYKE